MSSAQQGPIRVGVIGPFTGPSADFGIPMRNGIEHAVDEINAVGGYLGRPIELVIKDHTANPDVGWKRSEELIGEKVLATIGFCNTGVAAKSLDVFQKKPGSAHHSLCYGNALDRPVPGP